jgi:hypothetical protein
MTTLTLNGLDEVSSPVTQHPHCGMQEVVLSPMLVYTHFWKVTLPQP